ncbi:pheromone/general odorant binding protein [Vibrio phage 1.104.O._10N.286.49.A12]|nr:pheromone/general odorant binding protein [Vibrio phage 1.104.O._10N.286.49.A12]
MSEVNLLKYIPKEELETLPFFKNRGCWFKERALIDDEQGFDELQFSNAIKEYFERHNVEQLTERCSSKEEVVFTVFQWLTTNIGKSVLNDALSKTGRKIVDVQGRK